MVSCSSLEPVISVASAQALKINPDVTPKPFQFWPVPICTKSNRGSPD